MTPEDLRQLEEVGTPSEIAAGRVLIEHGQHGTGLYVILDGTVVVEAPDTTRELGPGSVIGERALFTDEGRRTARVRAVSDVRVVAVDRVQVEQLCAGDEGLAGRLADATTSSEG